MEYYFSVNTLDDDDKPVYPNYNSSYSIKHGFDSSKYLSSGLVLNTNFDSRDNTINPYKGIMADLKYYLYNKVLGSDKNRQTLNYEFRAYKSFSKESKYVLAFWTMGNFTLNGETPYLSLFSNGWDKFNTTGRAYIQGRFRGNDLLYAEIENRFSLTKNGLLGLVLFANAVSISNPDAKVKLMDHIEPAAGFGLRIKFDKYSRTNICVDFGIGTHGSKTVFLNIGEIFYFYFRILNPRQSLRHSSGTLTDRLAS
ncbi:MAG: BamA/TamA family outer membrane protein [Ignavibacteria bacterium]|nr:BamA/TamA family outer membrane protein [Ignavibacteria bacterium]